MISLRDYKGEINSEIIKGSIFDTNDINGILYNIFHREENSLPDQNHTNSASQDKEFRLFSQGEFRNLNNEEFAYINKIPTNTHSDYNLQTFLTTERDLHNRYIKLARQYRRHFKEPYRSQYHWNYTLLSTFNASSIVISVYLGFYKNNPKAMIGTLLFALAATLVQSSRIYTIAQNNYRSMFDLLPQQEVARRLQFLEDNRKLKKI
jgi:lipopolysaccharide export LptBFGC system permease protein LptF